MCDPFEQEREPPELEAPDPPAIEVEDTPNPVVASLLGPDGSPLFHVLARPRLALGFHPGPREPTRIHKE